MRAALALADEAAAAGEVPIGAVVVADGRVIGRGYNRPIGSHDPTAHAEIVAMREAARATGNYRLTGATLYVTVEPCLMCVGAIGHARIQALVYGAPEPRRGAVESTAQLADHPSLHHRLHVVSGVLAVDGRQRLQAFFASRR